MVSTGPIGKANRPSHPYDAHKLDDITSRIENIVQTCKIVEVVGSKAKVEFYGNFIPDFFYPFLQQGSADAIEWNPPNVGDLCMFLSIGGDLTIGYILPFRLPNGFNTNRKTYEFIGKNSFNISYDKQAKEYLIKNATNEIRFNEDTIKLKNKETTFDVKDDSINISVGGTNVVIDSSGISCNKQVKDLNGSMQEMRTTYNTHTHATPAGPSSGPSVSMN